MWDKDLFKIKFGSYGMEHLSCQKQGCSKELWQEPLSMFFQKTNQRKGMFFKKFFPISCFAGVFLLFCPRKGLFIALLSAVSREVLDVLI